MKKSKLTISEDQFKHITSTLNGANISTLTFNIDLMALYYPNIVIDLLKIYSFLPLFNKNEPIPPDEDFELALTKMLEFMKNDKD